VTSYVSRLNAASPVGAALERGLAAGVVGIVSTAGRVDTADGTTRLEGGTALLRCRVEGSAVPTALPASGHTSSTVVRSCAAQLAVLSSAVAAHGVVASAHLFAVRARLGVREAYPSEHGGEEEDDESARHSGSFYYLEMYVFTQ